MMVVMLKMVMMEKIKALLLILILYSAFFLSTSGKSNSQPEALSWLRVLSYLGRGMAGTGHWATELLTCWQVMDSCVYSQGAVLLLSMKLQVIIDVEL